MDTPQVQVDGPEVIPPLPETSQTETPDVDMNGTQDSVNDSHVGNTQDTTLPDAPHAVIESNPKSTEESQAALKKKPVLQFLDFLTSPIVELVVGQGGKKTVMTAHQTLLLESPYLSEFVAAFGESGPRRIELPDESVEAFSCFLQFQYTRDYSTSQATRTKDADAVVGEIDDSGEQLLQHARVYTLAEKLGMPALKNLAHSKIHKINSTSQGELAYARYVYTHTLSTMSQSASQLLLSGLQEAMCYGMKRRRNSRNSVLMFLSSALMSSVLSWTTRRNVHRIERKRNLLLGEVVGSG